ncbi:hypothetical protein [Sphingomonas sp. 3-13AW]|uniref:hypothetical protein n=1 Tax=Sphingomonas sp. 3-13AW TaxID=3050450 RepID=UPI003BB62CAA
MLTHPDYVDDAHELAADEAYSRPAWYATDMNGLVAGPFDTADEAEWWITKALRV